MPPHRHNAGSLKQKNKAHGGSGGHSSKRSLKRAQGGKVNVNSNNTNSNNTTKGNTTINGMNTGGKLKRLQETKQLRKQKKAKGFLERRTGTSLGAPKVILLMPMGDNADECTLSNEIFNAADRTKFSTLNQNEMNGSFLAIFENLKTRIHVISAPKHFGSFELLNISKSADVIVPIFSALDGNDNAVSTQGLERVALLRAHGMPAVVGCLQHTSSLSIKIAGEFKRMATKFITDEFGEHAKLVATNPHQALICNARLEKTNAAEPMSRPTGVDMSSFLRTLSQLSLRSLAWRDLRAYMLASDISMLRRLDIDVPENCSNETEPVLSVSGYLRGAPLNVDQLIHVPGIGARRILKILGNSDPCPLRVRSSSSNQMATTNVLAEGDVSRTDPLRLWATPNSLIGEQTWPNMSEYEDENGNDMNEEGLPKKKPAGVSEYQAVWMGSDNEGDDDDDEEGGVVSLGSVAGQAFMQDSVTNENDEEEDDEEEDDAQFSFLKSDDGGLKLSGLDEMTAEELAIDKEERRRARANEDYEFPDEVDVPADMLAKDRFARYRSLESFRMSPWDPKESLPRAYGRLFDFGNFKSTQKRILEKDLAMAKKAETANLLKLLPSSSGVGGGGGGGEVNSSSFSLSGSKNHDEEDEEDGMANTVGGGNEEEEEEDEQTGLRSNGWLSSGSYVTLILAPISDQELDDKGNNSQETVAASFDQDTASFTRLLDAHATCSSAPISLHALHRHENRLTVIHASIQRASSLFLPQGLNPFSLLLL